MSTTTTHKVSKPVHQHTRQSKEYAASEATVSKTWQIINSTNAPVVIIDAYLSDASGIEVLYQRSLQLLSTTDGLQSVNAGEAKTIAFADVHTDADGNDLGYSIIIANAADLFPIKVVDLPAGKDSFAAVMVTKDDVALLKGAEDFQQAIIAFPSSDMAAGFADVVMNGDEQAITTFLAGYPSYGAITLETIAAVQTYYNCYGIVWAGKDGAKLYNLFTSNDTEVVYLGQLSVNYQSEGPVTHLKSPAGFSASFIDADEKTTTLYYANGQFSEDVNSTAPAICLQSLFILKSQLTANSGDNQLEPVVYGSVNGNEVFGCTDQQDAVMSVASVSDDIKDFFDFDEWQGWAKLAGMVLGLLAGIGIAALVVYYVRNKRSPLTKEELIKRNRQAVQDALNRMDKKVRDGLKIPDDTKVAIDGIKRQASNNLLTDSRKKMQDILNNQSDMYNALMDHSNTDAMQTVYDNIYNDTDTLSTITPEGLAGSITDIMGRINYNTNVLGNVAKSVSKKLKPEEKEIIDRSTPIVDKFSKAVKENEDIREDLLKDRIPEVEG